MRVTVCSTSKPPMAPLARCTFAPPSRAAPAQHRHRHGPHRLHRGRLHDVLRLQRQQSVHVRAGRTSHACRRLLCRSEGAAGDTHQLVVFQQALLPRIGHDIAEETTAHDAKFRFHVSVSPFSRRVGGFFLSQYTMSTPEKQMPRLLKASPFGRGGIAQAMTERASPSPESRHAAISRFFERAKLCPNFSIHAGNRVIRAGLIDFSPQMWYIQDN